MPNPPITVGELIDVPAPESPINAQFHQEVANRVVHRFATVALMNAWAAANGSLAFVSPTHYARSGGVWQPLGYQSDIDARPLFAHGTITVPSSHTPGNPYTFSTGLAYTAGMAIYAVSVLELLSGPSPYDWRNHESTIRVLTTNPVTIRLQITNPDVYLRWGLSYYLTGGP